MCVCLCIYWERNYSERERGSPFLFCAVSDLTRAVCECVYSSIEEIIRYCMGKAVPVERNFIDRVNFILLFSFFIIRGGGGYVILFWTFYLR